MVDGYFIGCNYSGRFKWEKMVWIAVFWQLREDDPRGGIWLGMGELHVAWHSPRQRNPLSGQREAAPRPWLVTSNEPTHVIAVWLKSLGGVLVLSSTQTLSWDMSI